MSPPGVSCDRAVVASNTRYSDSPVAPPPAVGSSHQTVVAGDPDRGGCFSAHLLGCRFLLCAPRGCGFARNKSARTDLHQPGAFASGDECVEKGLAHATMHAAEFRDRISADVGAGRCRRRTRLWSVVSFLLDLDAPVALANNTAAGRGFNGRIGRAIGRDISHVGLARAACSCIETDFICQCEGELGWS